MKLSPRIKILSAFFAALVVFTAGAIITRQKGKFVPLVKNPPGTNSAPAPTSGGYTKLIIPQREPAFFTLKPEVINSLGILPKQVFVLTTAGQTSTDFIQERLVASVPVTITQAKPTEYRIAPQSSLGPDQVIKFRLAVKNTDLGGHVFDRDYSWSYQTQGKFQITGSLPGNHKKDVPVNTGIEIVFSLDDYQEPTPFLTISPKIQFRTERHGQTFAIIPLSPLAYKTVYTVTLKKGVGPVLRNDPLNEDFVFEFQTAEPEAVRSKAVLGVAESFIQTSAKDPPIVKLYAYDWPANQTVKTKIFKFGSGQEFVDSRKNLDKQVSYWYSFFQEDTPIDTKNLNKSGEADLPVSSRDNLSYIQLPQALGEGFYLIQFWYNDGQKLEQVWVQSTPIAAYMNAGRVQTLVWANDLNTGDPASSSAITVPGQGGTHYTSGNGAAVFSTPDIFYEPSVHYVLITSAKGQQVYLPVRSLKGEADQNQKTESDYWSYLYNERRLYKPTDTINFWGVAKDRNTNQGASVLTARLTSGYSWGDTSTVTEKAFQANSNGTFMDSLSFSEIPAGWYSLKIYSGLVLLASQSFEVIDYVKPEMKIDVSADKKAVFAGEKIKFNAAVSFFDGTPGKQIDLSVHEDQSSKTTDKTTDNTGQIIFEYTPTYAPSGGVYSGYPRYESITANPKLSGNATIEGYGSVMVYGPKVMLTSASFQNEQRATVKAKLNRVDLTQINGGTGSEVKGSLIANTDVSFTLMKTWWERVQDGTYYDYFEKVTYPAYRYVKHDEKIADQKLKTNIGGEVSFDFDMERDRSYMATLTAVDENGRTEGLQEYFYYYRGSNYSDETAEPKLTLAKKDNLYSKNEEIKAMITVNDKAYKDTPLNRFLFIAASRGKQDFFVENEPQETLVYAEKYIPNVTLGAVIFTGSYYLNAAGECIWDWYCDGYYGESRFDGVTLKYKSDDKKMDLVIEADKKKYLPGDTALVTVNVSLGGIPQADAEVNLVLVDQALAAIGGVVPPSTLSSLYKTVPNQIYYNYYSHKPALPTPPQAEKGGGGGENREIFKDTAYFGRAKTDGNGKASFTFKLSDNITTWIVYSQAVTSETSAGQQESKLVVSKDFFITNETPREYLTADKAQMAGAAFGNGLNSGDMVNFTATIIKGEDTITKTSKDQTAFKEVSFPIPSLGAGDYKAIIRGTKKDLVDQVTYPFKVIDSRFNFQVATTVNLAAGERMTSPNTEYIKESQPITLTISDKGQGRYLYQLKNYCYTASNRLEKWIAQTASAKILTDRFNIKNCGSGDWDRAKFQDIDGGLSQVKWGGSNLETTVWALYVLPNGFDKDKLISYFESKIRDNPTNSLQKIYSFWGLALLGKPQLNRLEPLVDIAVSNEEKLVGALALTASGQIEKAREIYFDVLADSAYVNNPYVRIYELSNEKMVANTALALLLGSIMNKDYDAGLYAYLRDYSFQAPEVVQDLSKMAFMDEELLKLPEVPTKVKISSTLQNSELDLSNRKYQIFDIKPEELKSLKVEVITGKAEASLSYFVGANGFNTAGGDGRLSIKRTFRKVTGTGDKITPGDIVEIKLECKVNEPSPRGSYEITDYLPSGLVFLNSPWAYGLKETGWVDPIERQKVRSYLYYSPDWKNYDNGIRIYFARAAFPGTYTAEPAVIQSSSELSVYNSSGTGGVIIENQ